MSALKEVTDNEFDKQVTANDRPVLVDFWAPWCGPCKALTPTLEALSEEFQGAVDFMKIDIDDNAATRDRFGVRGVPTLVLFKGGEEVMRLVGTQTRAKLAGILNDLTGRVPVLMSAKRAPTSAFGGDPERKVACIARLKRHIANGDVNPGMTHWDGAAGSAMACAVERGDVDECAETLGIPASLVSLVDILSTYHGTMEECTAFVLRWIEGLTIGADFSKLPARLLIYLLEGGDFNAFIAEHPDLCLIRDRIVALHRVEVDAALSPSVDGWADVYREANTIACQEGKGGRKAIAKCLHAASVSISRDPDVVANTVSAVAMIAMSRAMAEHGWTNQDEGGTGQKIKEIMEAAIRNGEEPSNVDGLARLAKVEPDLARRFSEQYAARQAAMGRIGQQLSQVLEEMSAAPREGEKL